MSVADKPKRIGRPRLDASDVSVPVTVKLPARQYDAYDKVARDKQISVAEVIRRKLRGES